MEVQQATSTHDRHGMRSSNLRKQVLVVDDSDECRAILEEFLKMQGHVVRTATDGVAALAVLKTFHPDVAFVDICMPRMDGFELCMRLKSDRTMGDLAVFALSAGPYGEKIAASASAGFDAYLRKPVELDVVDGLIRAQVS